MCSVSGLTICLIGELAVRHLHTTMILDTEPPPAFLHLLFSATVFFYERYLGVISFLPVATCFVVMAMIGRVGSHEDRPAEEQFGPPRSDGIVISLISQVIVGRDTLPQSCIGVYGLP
jgi:hypothetical protein